MTTIEVIDKTPETKERPKIALVLGSGGARGLAHIGVLKILEKLKIPIDMVIGSSMGALIGGAYASGLSATQIEGIACETNWLKVARILFPKRLQMAGLLDGGRVQDFLISLIGEKNIQDLNIPFACVATDIMTGDEIILNSGSVAESIRASTSFPFLFSPMKIDGRLLVDGGVVNPLPTNVARNMGATKIIAVITTSPIKRHFEKIKSEKITSSNRIMTAINSSSFYKRHSNYIEKENNISINSEENTITSLGIRQQMIQVGTTMENMILNLRLDAEPADILISPNLDDIQFMDFTNAKDIIMLGQREAENKLFQLHHQLDL